MKTTEDQWASRLASPGVEQEEAITELRVLLTNRVERAMSGNRRVDAAFIEDIVQDSLISILESLGQFQGRSQFLTWATTIAIRRCFSELRRKRWKDVSLDQLVDRNQSWVGSLGEKDSPSEKENGQLLLQELRHAIETKLTQRQRFALMAEISGCPLEEIGRRLGSNRNAVYKLTHDARKKLRKHLIADGYCDQDLENLRGNC